MSISSLQTDYSSNKTGEMTFILNLHFPWNFLMFKWRFLLWKSHIDNVSKVNSGFDIKNPLIFDEDGDLRRSWSNPNRQLLLSLKMRVLWRRSFQTAFSRVLEPEKLKQKKGGYFAILILHCASAFHFQIKRTQNY